MPSDHEIVAYAYPGWNPRLRPAGVRRDWMDDSPESFPYRCLPLRMANGHGWEIECPCDVSAVWTGGPAPGDVVIHPDNPAVPPADLPVALFGQGVLTFHVQAILRTPPGTDLWLSGPPNACKDGIAPLSGLIETDWSPYTFTMNWRFTRPNLPVHFRAGEPIGFFFPVPRGGVERHTARIASIDENPALKAEFEAWSASRDAFQRAVAADPPRAPADKWQKLYYRGLTPDGSAAAADHRTRVDVCPFTASAPDRPGRSIDRRPPGST